MNNNFAFSIKTDQETKDWGRYIISPLPEGFGQTIGHSLRRVLLGALPGAAAIQMKIAGATHIFTTLKGVKEDLVEVMLNVKQIRFSYQGEKPVKLKLEKTGPGPVKAGDIELQPGVEVANPDLVLANLADSQTKFKMELTVARGVGYEPAEEHKSDKLGVIALDAVFTPIKKVNYRVESTRKGRKTNWDKLILEVWTDGSIKPKKAVKQAAKILMAVFKQVVSPKKIEADDSVKEERKQENSSLNLLLEEIDEIPLRLVNALKKAGYKRVKDLVKAGPKEVLKARNVGEKSVEQLIEILKKRGVELKD